MSFEDPVARIPAQSCKMVRFMTWLCVALLEVVCAQPVLKNKDFQVDLGKVIANSAFFIPVYGPQISATLNLASSLIKVGTDDYDSKNPVPVDYFERQFGLLNIGLTEVKTEIPIEVYADRSLSELYKIIDAVKNIYKEYNFKYRTKTVDHESSEAKFFVDTFCTTHNLKGQLDLMKQILVGNHQTMNLLQGLAMTGDSQVYLCKKDNSHQNRIIRIRHDVMITELKALELAHFRYLVISKTTNSSRNQEHALIDFQYLVEMFVNRTVEIQPLFGGAAHYASRYFWKCDPPIHREGKTFITLDPIFRTHVVKEGDLVNQTELYKRPSISFSPGITIFKDSSSGSCNRFRIARENIKHMEETIRPVCQGLVRDCYDSANDATVCFDKVGDRFKYEAIKFEDGRMTWGNDKSLCNNYTNFERRYSLTSVSDVCLCKCDEFGNNQAVRYFSTLKCSSDYHDNKVITGVQLIRRGLYIHIKIQQAVMKDYANVDKDTLGWKQDCTNVPESSFAQKDNSYKVTWDTRSVSLDNLTCRKDTVVTALKFNDDQGSLRLEIFCTPFDITSGRLVNNHHKVMAFAGKRTLLKIDNHLPTKTGNIDVLGKFGSKVNFTVSNDPEDAGSSVVPFIDVQPVSVADPTPLVGISLIHRGNMQSSGYLALQIKSFDYSLYLRPESEEYLRKLFKIFFEELKRSRTESRIELPIGHRSI